MKENKKSITIIILIICIILEIIGIVVLKNKLTKEERIVYDIVEQKQADFKNPSTVKVVDATVYDEKYVIMQVGGNNSFGAFVSSTYYVKDNTLYTKDDNYQIAKEVVDKCFEIEKDKTSKINKLDKKSIDKINHKLEKRYK